jgi:hypothetical protein
MRISPERAAEAPRLSDALKEKLAHSKLTIDTVLRLPAAELAKCADLSAGEAAQSPNRVGSGNSTRATSRTPAPADPHAENDDFHPSPWRTLLM